MRERGPRPGRGPRTSLVQAIVRHRPRSDEPTVEGERAGFPDDLPDAPYDPELAEAALEVGELLDLFPDELDELHPRLTRPLDEDWFAGGDEPD
jgi:hypothetical protein